MCGHFNPTTQHRAKHNSKMKHLWKNIKENSFILTQYIYYDFSCLMHVLSGQQVVFYWPSWSSLELMDLEGFICKCKKIYIYFWWIIQCLLNCWQLDCHLDPYKISAGNWRHAFKHKTLTLAATLKCLTVCLHLIKVYSFLYSMGNRNQCSSLNLKHLEQVYEVKVKKEMLKDQE